MNQEGVSKMDAPSFWLSEVVGQSVAKEWKRENDFCPSQNKKP